MTQICTNYHKWGDKLNQSELRWNTSQAKMPVYKK
jgi:hypothetical protein